MKQIKFLYPIAMLVLFVVGFVALPEIMGAISPYGIGLAMVGGGIVPGSGIATTAAVSALQPELNMDDVSDRVTKMRPAASPIATIFASHAKKRRIESQRTEFYAVDIKPFFDTVRVAYAGTVDGQSLATIAVNDINMFDVDDTVMFRGIAGVDGRDFVGSIAQKNIVARTINVQPLNGPLGSGSMAATEIVPRTIDINTRIVRMGVAKSELDAQTAPFAIIPGKEFNFAQNFMAQVEESVFQRLTKKEVAWGFTDYEEMNIYDMKARQELSYIFGVRKSFIDAVDNEQKFTCGGLTRFMTKTQNYTVSSGITQGAWVDWMQLFFADNAGSDTRFLFAGDGLISAISKIAGVEKQLEAKSVEVKWGINFNVVETKFGILYVKRHPLLAIAGVPNDGLVIDVNNIEEHEFVPLKFTQLDLKSAGLRNSDATVLQKVSCPVLRYPATHAYIRGV